MEGERGTDGLFQAKEGPRAAGRGSSAERRDRDRSWWQQFGNLCLSSWSGDTASW